MRAIYGAEQRSDRGQSLAALRVAAARAAQLGHGSWTMARIVGVALPRCSTRGARNATHGTFTTGC